MNDQSINPPLLRIDHATVRRSGRRILDDVSFEIPEGRHTAILGPNGSGKTTLIKLIALQHYALAHEDESPSVTIFGKDRWDVFELRAMLGIVSSDLQQEFIGGGGITGLDLVVSGFFAGIGLARHHAVTDAMRSSAIDALDMVDASHLGARFVETMSTGEARRVLIARALISRPRALLLDEPTTGLDIVARHAFLETIRGLLRTGKTLVLITHHIEEVLPEVEHVILMQNGRIAVGGRKEDVLTSDNMTRVYGASVVVRQVGQYYAADVDR